MKYLKYIVILISINAHAQIGDSGKISDPQEYSEMIDYVNNLDQGDTSCLADIKRAKEDLAKGKVVFTQTMGFLFGHIRFENELQELCRKNGLYYGVEMISDIEIDGQTQGCYGAYMDKIIIEKFGAGFKEKLRAKADSLFLAKANTQNKIVQYWDCDERPRLPEETERNQDYLTTINVNKLDIVKDESDYGGWPFFDLGFIIEKDSSISGFYIRNFVPHLGKNEKFEDELFKLAVQELKTNYSKWVPGTIKGIPVRTDNNVRIFFEKEE